MRRLRIALTLLLPVLVAGCSKPDLSTPEGAYRAFHQAVVDQDWDLAMTFIPSQHLDTFRQVGRRWGKAVGQEGDPLDLFLRGVRGHPVVPLRAIEVVSRGDQTAVIRITAGPCEKNGQADQCSVSEVTLRRQGQGWLLEPEMPELLSGGEG